MSIETITQTYTGVPMRKLRELLASGWVVNGVAITRTEEDGTMQRGAVTTGGMVLWWNQEPAPVQVPLFWYRPCPGGMYEGPVHNNSVGGKMLRDEKPDDWKPLFISPPAQPAVPLTDEQIGKAWAVAEGEHNASASVKRRITRSIEAAHNIKEQS